MKKIDSLPAAALLLASSVLLSRLFGYAREMLLAYKFGASATTDAFYAAFQIPDLLNYFLAGGALSIAFIPLYNKTLARDGSAAAERLVSVTLGTLGSIAVLLTVLLWVKADALTAFQFSSFTPETAAETTRLTRIVLPAQIFFIVGGILQAVLMAGRYFMAAALAPLIYNVSIIAGGVFLTPVIGIDGFAYGTLAGAFLGPFLLPLLQCLKQARIRPSISLIDPAFRTYILLALPLMFGQTLLTLDEWYGRWFGADLGTGAIAHLGYARRLMQVPIAVIGQAVAAAALPTLSRLYAENKTGEMNSTLQRTLSLSLMLAVFAGTAFTLLARPVVDLLYHHGAFTADDAAKVSTLTAIFALAIPAWIAQQIVVRGFYARGDTWRPMILGTIISISVIPLYQTLAKSTGTEGLALAGALAMSVNGIGTLLLARGYHGAPSLRALGGSLLRAVIISGFACVAAEKMLELRPVILPLESARPYIIAAVDIFMAGGVFGIVTLAAALLIGGDDIYEFISSLKARIARKKTI